MLKPEAPDIQTGLVVPPKGMEIVLAEDEYDPLALVLPPLDDLEKIHTFKLSHHSLSERAANEATRLANEFAFELERAKAKISKHSDSPTYLNRLANLAAAAGKHDEEAHYLELAEAISDHSAFFRHRLGDNFAVRNMIPQAQEMFSHLDLSTDLEANLKLAMFAVRNQDLGLASSYVQRAVSIDPANFAARLFEGGLCLARQNWNRAIHSFRIASEARPNSSVLFCNLGIAFMQIGENAKALSALKRAVALGPLNENAVVLLSDFSFHQGSPEEALSSLRLFLSLEQRNAGAWRRLARLYLHTGQTAEAVEALRAEAAIAESSDVWNNLGVAYVRLGDRERALRAFNYALGLGVKAKDHGYFLAALNIAQHLSVSASEGKFLWFCTTLAEEDTNRACLRDPVLSDIYAFYLFALGKAGKLVEMRERAERLLETHSAADSLVAWILSTLIAQYALYPEKECQSLEFIDQHRKRIEEILRSSSARDRDVMLCNNAAFAYAECNRLADAQVFLRKIAKRVSRDPYPTATLGLIDLRKGRLERGLMRYTRAVGLANTRNDKERIRQKMSLELGKYWLSRNLTRAQRYLRRAASSKAGEDALRDEAREILKRLPAAGQ